MRFPQEGQRRCRSTVNRAMNVAFFSRVSVFARSARGEEGAGGGRRGSTLAVCVVLFPGRARQGGVDVGGRLCRRRFRSAFFEFKLLLSLSPTSPPLG